MKLPYIFGGLWARLLHFANVSFIQLFFINVQNLKLSIQNKFSKFLKLEINNLPFSE